LSRVILENK
jgi:signal transduction histidine kinase